jgi:signal transduction histidine kinase
MSGPPNDLTAALQRRWGPILEALDAAGHPQADSRRILHQLLTDVPPADQHYWEVNLIEFAGLFVAIRNIVLKETPIALGRPMSDEESAWLDRRLDTVLEQALESLAHRAAHDIRGGLNAILLTTEVIGNDVQRVMPDSMEDVRQIKESVEETLAAVDRWLRKAKPPEGA